MAALGVARLIDHAAPPLQETHESPILVLCSATPVLSGWRVTDCPEVSQRRLLQRAVIRQHWPTRVEIGKTIPLCYIRFRLAAAEPLEQENPAQKRVGKLLPSPQTAEFMKPVLSPSVQLDFFQQLWQKSDDPFWLCECAGDDFVIVAVNPAELVIDSRLQPGVSIRSLIGYGPEADVLLAGYFECRDTGRTVSFKQQLVIAGTERLFQTLLVPVTDAAGRVSHISGTARDLTSFLSAQKALEKLNRELEQRVEERTQALNQANAELREANQVLEKLAALDSLTELANRRCFFEHATTEVVRAQRYGHPLALQMLDIDHFKAINDCYGHAAGDSVLQQLASVLRSNLRHNDMAARIGGEEFVVLLPETRLEDAALHAERLRHAVEEIKLPFSQEMQGITVSIGVASLGTGELSAEPMLTRADNALYRAKTEGRNRVEVFWGGQVSGSLWLL